MNYRPYESFLSRRWQRNRKNERAILASGICSFISSILANAIVTNGLKTSYLVLVPAFILFYCLLYLLYGKLCETVLGLPQLSKRFSKSLYREDLVHIIIYEMPNDLQELMKEFREISTDCNEKEALKVKACYEMSQMLDFLEYYKGDIFFANTRYKSNTSSSISRQSIATIVKSISIVLKMCEPFEAAHQQSIRIDNIQQYFRMNSKDSF